MNEHVRRTPCCADEAVRYLVANKAVLPRMGDPDCVEYILEDGRRFAWSESNVQYEEVPQDGASFTLLRDRLTRCMVALQGLWNHTQLPLGNHHLDDGCLQAAKVWADDSN